MALIFLRTLFCMVSLGIAVLIFNSPSMRSAPNWVPWVVLLVMIGIPLSAILIDLFIKKKDLTVITSVYFGLLIGVFLTYVAVLALSPLLASFATSPVLPWTPLILGMLLCYVSTSVLMQTRNDFRFIIPYVEFARDVRGLRPNVLDASAIVDGRTT